MKNLRVGLVITAVLTLFALGAVALIPAKPPRVVLDHTNYDAGEHLPGETIYHSFNLTNAGGRRLDLSELHASCSCSKARITKTQLRPGESARIDVEMTPKSDAYISTANISVHTNDPSNPTLILTLDVRNSPYFEIVPTTIDLGKVPYDRRTPTTLDFKVFCRHPEAFRVVVSDLVSPSPVRAEFSPEGGVGGRPALRVSLAADAPIGPFTAKVVVLGKPEREGGGAIVGLKPIEFDVRGAVTGPLRTDPPKALVRANRSNLSATYDVAIVGERPNNALPAIENVSEGIRPYVDPRTEMRDGRPIVRIGFKPAIRDAADMAVKGVIRLKVGDGVAPSLNLPVQLFIASDGARDGR